MGFWIFVGLVVLATTYDEIEQKKLRAKLMQIALEKGKDLDPQLLEQLFPGENKDGIPTDPSSLRVTATVIAFIGVGLGVLALALKQIGLKPYWICLGLGGFALVVSIGIYVASRMIAARQQADSSFVPPKV